MSPAHLRIVGYLVTILVHSANILHMFLRLEWASRDPVIKEWATLRFKFLTNWTFLFQIAYAYLGLYCDNTSLNNKTSELHRYLLSVRETIFTAIMWPTSLLVFTLFWPLYLYDEGFIFPPFIDQVLNWTNNHVIHTFIIPVVVWELWLLPRSKPTHGFNISLLFAYIISYLYVLIHTYHTKNVWVYPMLNMIMGTMYFPLFFIGTAILLPIVYYVQWPLYTFMKSKTNSPETLLKNRIEENVKKIK